MNVSMHHLLVHSDLVPPSARAAIREAMSLGPEAAPRAGLLETAARIIHHEVGLDCSEARSLVGLPGGSCA